MISHQVIHMPEDSYSIKETLAHYFDEMKEDIKEIKVQTTKTNGRVSSLESSRDRLWGGMALLTLLGGAIITLSVMAIDTKIEKAITTALEERINKIEYAE